MATQLQLRRGTEAQTSTFTGAEGEVTVNTTNDSLVVHDGITPGGFEAARVDLVNVDNATFAAKAAAANVGGGGGGGASTTATVSSVTQSNPGVVTTSAPHNFGSGQLVTFNGVGGMTQLNGNSYYAKATSAQYADLAEYYMADRAYPAGTVMKFGGSNEITEGDQDHDPAVAGVVSEKPAYVMNAGLEGENAVPIALAGRVPCLVQGPIRKGQMLVSAGNGRARAEVSPAMGTVVGKALENFDGDLGTIEIVVGRL